MKEEYLNESMDTELLEELKQVSAELSDEVSGCGCQVNWCGCQENGCGW